jgi:lipoprotein-anchoring transpeptidase ErfK/SrfK
MTERAPDALPRLSRRAALRATLTGLAAAGVALALPDAAQARRSVDFSGYAPGTIVVRTSQRRLFLVTGGGQAISYPVGVGRRGLQWTGTRSIKAKYVEPAWSPPAIIRRDRPNLPDVIPGGSPQNPMGARVLSLGGEYAIHGTNQPGSIGGFVSYGCIRMHNEDIIDLYRRVSVGTPVIVLP